MSASPPPQYNGEGDEMETAGATFELAKDGDQNAQGHIDQISAADYDPSNDRREDEQRRMHVADGHRHAGANRAGEAEIEVEVIEEEEEEDDVDDMFAVVTSDADSKPNKVKKVKKISVVGFFLRDISPEK